MVNKVLRRRRGSYLSACLGVVTITVMSTVATGFVGVAQAAPGPATPTAAVDDAFYQPPNPLPAGSPGELIRSESFRTALTVPTIYGKVPATATRLLYRSTDATGTPVAVSGYFLEPTRAWPGPGPRPIIDYAGGLHGQGDQCAASKLLQSGVELDGPGGFRGEIEQIVTYNLLAKGYAVVGTDYIGMGTPGVHTFGLRVDQGNAVLDAGRAALRLPGVAADSKIAIVGYSQGGGAAAAAAELAAIYAPDLPLVGVYAGGIPAELQPMLDHLDGGRLSGIIGYVLNGLIARYPEFATSVAPLLNPNGRSTLARIATECIGLTAIRSVATSTWTTTGQDFDDIIDDNPVIAKYVDEQTIGTEKPTVPVLFTANPVDPTVPIAIERSLHAKWCAQDPASLQYAEVPVPIPFVGASPVGHVAGGISGITRALSWLSDRFAGRPPVVGCVG